MDKETKLIFLAMLDVLDDTLKKIVWTNEEDIYISVYDQQREKLEEVREKLQGEQGA